MRRKLKRRVQRQLGAEFLVSCNDSTVRSGGGRTRRSRGGGRKKEREERIQNMRQGEEREGDRKP